jgi:hypothetical protein
LWEIWERHRERLRALARDTEETRRRQFLSERRRHLVAERTRGIQRSRIG